ncbi:MAG: major tail protein [Oscillospiraceae bacterium]
MADANKVIIGLENFHIALITSYDAVTKKYTYGTPTRVPGLVSLDISTSGGENTFYADNIAYFKSNTNQGYELKITIANLTEFIREEVLGEKKQLNGLRVEFANAIPKDCAILFEVSGDTEGERYVFYNSTMSRPNINRSTKGENAEPQTNELTLKATARENDKAVKAFITEKDTAYATFFNSVLEPEEVTRVMPTSTPKA